MKSESLRSTAAAGSLRVEFQDVNGQPLPGYAFDECPPIFNTVERTATWTTGNEVGALAGRSVRRRFVFKDAELHAFQFNE